MVSEPHDRTRTFGRQAQSTAEISDDELPEEGAHKTQLQGIVGRHPIEPGVREGER